MKINIQPVPTAVRRCRSALYTSATPNKNNDNGACLAEHDFAQASEHIQDLQQVLGGQDRSAEGRALAD
jgi:hypothetical protein